MPMITSCGADTAANQSIVAVKGDKGDPGEVGATGPAGPVGATGPSGAKGDTGAPGEDGEKGSKGLTGSVGATGATGATGPAGATGAPGEDGAPGEQGIQGIPGEQGPEGPAGTNGLSEYAYIYNLNAQVIAIESPVMFSNNGVIVGEITHTPGTSTISIGTAGDYAIWFTVSGVEPNQFTLFINASPVSGSTFGSGAGTQTNSGMVIITAAAGDVLQLGNHTSAAAVTLQTLAGGTQTNTNASILIQKIG